MEKANYAGWRFKLRTSDRNRGQSITNGNNEHDDGTCEWGKSIYDYHYNDRSADYMFSNRVCHIQTMRLLLQGLMTYL